MIIESDSKSESLTEVEFMSKDIFIDVTNICLGIVAIFLFSVAVSPYMQVIP
jgi:hypothetical protein